MPLFAKFLIFYLITMGDGANLIIFASSYISIYDCLNNGSIYYPNVKLLINGDSLAALLKNIF